MCEVVNNSAKSFDRTFTVAFFSFFFAFPVASFAFPFHLVLSKCPQFLLPMFHFGVVFHFLCLLLSTVSYWLRSNKLFRFLMYLIFYCCVTKRLTAGKLHAPCTLICVMHGALIHINTQQTGFSYAAF